MRPLHRRHWLAGTSALAAGTFLGLGRPARAAAPKASILETKVISNQPQLYHGWPTVARRKSGELILVCSGGRAEHVCPFGRVELMRSHDEGKTWGLPNVVFDTEIDDRDAGVMETAKGTLLVTTFTSPAYEPLLAGKKVPAAELPRWQAAHNRLTDAQRKSLLGCWMLRSTDGGLTWSSPYRCIVSSPHGPIQLSDGRLLYAGNELWTPEVRLSICESSDDGQTWRRLAEVKPRQGDSHKLYYEMHAVETNDGRILVQIRNHNAQNAQETLQIESSDGGKTWSMPRVIGVWGLPSHLLKLRDGRILMTYGYRRKPFGNQARVSEDHGRTWSEPITISGDGPHGDLGYPSTVQLADGSLLTVWYETAKPKAVLRQARWTLD